MNSATEEYLNKIDLDEQEIEKRKTVRRKLWDYEKVEFYQKMKTLSYKYAQSMNWRTYRK